jgi:hypothetical protein
MSKLSRAKNYIGKVIDLEYVLFEVSAITFEGHPYHNGKKAIHFVGNFMNKPGCPVYDESTIVSFHANSRLRYKIVK